MKRQIALLLTVVMLLTMAAPGLAQEPVKLTLLTHWGEERLLVAQQAMIDAYVATHPNVTIELQTVPFNDLYTRIVASRTAGTSPDIYHLYNLWLPEFTNGGMLAPMPEALAEWVSAEAAGTSVAGVTYNDQLWGVPTEVNTYLLIYNKRLLAEAGFDAPPATWAEVEEIAPLITKKDDTGAVTQVGMAVITGWDSGVVHPFMALLYSNGGEYFSEDLTTVAFDSPQGLETLQLYQNLLDSGGIDMSVPWGDLANGNVGMLIMANWYRATLMASENIDYATEIGVAPVPVGPSGTESSTLAYNWLWSVDAGSPNQEAAWDFIEWMNKSAVEGEPSPMGDLLVNEFGSIPSMVPDQAAFAEELGDHFVAPFVESTAYARQEPVIGGSQEIKTMLQVEMESMFTGMTDPQSLIDYVAPEANAILEEFRMAEGG
jgi:multiple sugar transport system substrate-binding protein